MAGGAVFHFADVLAGGVLDGDEAFVLALGEAGGYAGGVFEDGVGEVAVLGVADDDVGAESVAGMEPDVGLLAVLEGELVVLLGILADEDGVAHALELDEWVLAFLVTLLAFGEEGAVLFEEGSEGFGRLGVESGGGTRERWGRGEFGECLLCFEPLEEFVFHLG